MSRTSYHSNHRKRAEHNNTKDFEHARSGVFCVQAQKHKICYETKKKAQRAISFNEDETQRYYWCPYCSGYHTTSKPYKEKGEWFYETARDTLAEIGVPFGPDGSPLGI